MSTIPGIVVVAAEPAPGRASATTAAAVATAASRTLDVVVRVFTTYRESQHALEPPENDLRLSLKSRLAGVVPVGQGPELAVGAVRAEEADLGRGALLGNVDPVTAPPRRATCRPHSAFLAVHRLDLGGTAGHACRIPGHGTVSSVGSELTDF